MSEALSLFRGLLRHGRRFKNYNFREYAVRRAREEFRRNQGLTDAKQVAALLEKGQQQLRVVERQALLSQMYHTGDYVMDNVAARRKQQQQQQQQQK